MLSVRFWLSFLVLAVLLICAVSQDAIEVTGDDDGASTAPVKPRGGRQANNQRNPNRGRGRNGRGRGRGGRGRGGGGGRGGVQGDAGGGAGAGADQSGDETLQRQQRNSVCNGPVTLGGSGGVINSPNYPNNYFNNLECVWIIRADGNNKIRVVFTEIDVEPQNDCSYDYVQILNFRGQSMGKRCGRWPVSTLALPQHVVESQSTLTIVFRSDNSERYKGFRATWSIVQAESYPGCQGQPNVIDGTVPGTISSPRFPNTYPAFLDCYHRISVGADQVIQLTLAKNSFFIERESSCAYDFLEIFDGQSSSSPSMSSGKMCGDGTVNSQWTGRPNGFPTTMTSASNYVYIAFHTDGSQQKKGWRIQYRAVNRPTVSPGGGDGGDKVIEACSGGSVILNEQSGIFTSMNYGEGEYPSSTTCKWKIQVPKGMVAAIEFEKFDLEMQAQCRYDSLTVFNGPDENEPILVKLCGNQVRDVRGTTHELFVVFTSDHSVQKLGFKARYSAKEPINYAGICGMSEIPQKISKIVGGQVANPNSWPWMVAIQKRSSQNSGAWGLLCGGSVISGQWILTAAHCVDTEGRTDPAYLFRIIAGDHSRYVEDGTEQIRLVIGVEKHPQYSDRTTDNDIALLKLDAPLQYNRYVQPICLPSVEAPPLTLCAMVGWGATDATASAPVPSGSSSDNSVLNQVFVPVLERNTCLDTRLRYKSFTTNMFCAGNLQGGKDTCQGDSGGPFMCKKNDAYVQYGITSWGYGCAERNSPGVYTQVVNYIGWILGHATDHHSLTKRDVQQQQVVVKDREPIVETYVGRNAYHRWTNSRLKSLVFKKK